MVSKGDTALSKIGKFVDEELEGEAAKQEGLEGALFPLLGLLAEAWSYAHSYSHAIIGKNDFFEEPGGPSRQKKQWRGLMTTASPPEEVNTV